MSRVGFAGAIDITIAEAVFREGEAPAEPPLQFRGSIDDPWNAPDSDFPASQVTTGESAAFWLSPASHPA